MNALAFDDAGAKILTTEFPFDELDAAAADGDPSPFAVSPPAAVLEYRQKIFREGAEWIWQDGMKNPDGVKIRAMIFCWVFLKHLRPMSETELATGYGLDKQSIGRWVEQFKKAFPEIRLVHMRGVK